MPFTISCPNCNAKLKATETLLGKTIKCPRCSRAVLVQQQAPISTMPRMEIPEAKEPLHEHLQLEETDNEGPSRAARMAGETDALPEVEDAPELEAAEGEEVEDAELDEVTPADDADYARRRRPPRRPAGVTPEDRQTAMFLYLLAIFTSFIGPLILWMMKREESKFINHHGKEVINFIITLIIPSLVLSVVGCPFVILTWGLAAFIVVPLFMALNIYALVMIIMGAMRANAGEWWEFPISIRMIK
ncbi:MAG TPA: DUF4870 domain-containing protein [Gemmataceae bacterium]|nr:DUF4870 domain-containing protein [Gemmataceae bacterium]